MRQATPPTLIQFSQPMQIGGVNGLGDSSLWLALNSQNGNSVTVVPGSLAWDWKTNTASWHLQNSGTGVFGQYAIHVAGTVLDRYGHAPDGEWTAPVANTKTATVSGTGAAGGEFVFTVLLLPGDADGDLTTAFADLGIVLNNYNHAGTWATGDFNGDGLVDFADLGVVLNWYNISIIL
jgi:hypothetical protein